MTSGRRAARASFAPGIGRAHQRRADEHRICAGQLGRGRLRAGLDRALGDQDAVAGRAREQRQLAAPVEIERRQVARVDADHRRVERDRTLELIRVVRLDERVEAERVRATQQRTHLHVVEIAQEQEHRVRPGRSRGLEIVRRREEALGEQGQRRGSARGAQIVPRAAEALVDEHRHRPGPRRS